MRRREISRIEVAEEHSTFPRGVKFCRPRQHRSEYEFVPRLERLHRVERQGLGDRGLGGSDDLDAAKDCIDRGADAADRGLAALGTPRASWSTTGLSDGVKRPALNSATANRSMFSAKPRSSRMILSSVRFASCTETHGT